MLITGGSGFIGRYFTDRLKQAEVILFDLRPPDYISHATYIKGDVRDEKSLLQSAQGCDLIIHLAAMHHDFGIEDSAYFDTNVNGARNVIAAAEKHDIRQIINFSSVAVYGNKGNPGPTTEETSPEPTNPYGHSKLEAEHLLLRWAQDSQNRKLINVRSTVVFGPFNLANVLNLIKAIDQGLYFHVGEGKNIKSLAYVENIVDASFFALEKASFGGFTFNYVDEPQLSSHQIANMQARMLGKKIHLRFPLWFALLLSKPFDWAIRLSGKNLKISSKRVLKLNTQTYHEAKAIKALGFQARHCMEDGMERMIRWYKSGLKKP